MSTEFTFAQICPVSAVVASAADIEAQLRALGYARSSTIIEVVFDDRGVFDEADRELDFPDALMSREAELASWQGIAVEFFNREFTLYLMLVVHSSGHLYAFLDMSAKVFDRLTEQHEMERLWQVVGVIADVCKSQGGFGGFEVPFEPFSQEEAIDRIFHNDEGVPSVLGLVPVSIFESQGLRKQAEADFTIISSTLGYCFLQNRDLG